MNFSDFKDDPQQLVGKIVLITNRYHQRITTINKVTVGKKHQFFTVVGDSADTFHIFSGTSRRNEGFYLTTCQLITDEQAREMKLEWTKRKQTREMRERIEKALPTLQYKDLHAMCNILDQLEK